jgi:predicted deacylase/nitrite reductase/ring-hydroxylating ferredoxin subunit
VTALACAADAAIDVHTAGNCIPYILLDPVKDAALSQATDALARATGITTIGEFTSERYESTGLAASLPPAVHAARKPAFTLELAGSGGVAWEQAEAGAIGLRNAIRHMGIVDDAREAIHGVPVHATDGHRRRAVFAERGGIVEFVVRPGDDVTRGQRLGRVRDVWGRVVEEIVSPVDGFVIGLVTQGATWTGGYVAELATRDFRTASGFSAIDDECPHRAGPLSEGTLETTARGTFVMCPFHGWQFDLATGACATVRGHGVQTYAVRVDASGVSVIVPDDP